VVTLAVGGAAAMEKAPVPRRASGLTELGNVEAVIGERMRVGERRAWRACAGSRRAAERLRSEGAQVHIFCALRRVVRRGIGRARRRGTAGQHKKGKNSPQTTG